MDKDEFGRLIGDCAMQSSVWAGPLNAKCGRVCSHIALCTDADKAVEVTNMSSAVSRSVSL